MRIRLLPLPIGGTRHGHVRCLFLLSIGLILSSPLSGAVNEPEDPVEVVVTGEVAYVDITPAEASRRALEDARRKAIAEVIGIKLSSEQTHGRSETNGTIVDFFSSVTQSSYQGRIVEEKILHWQDDSLDSESTAPPINIRRVTIRALVAREHGSLDPSFLVNVKLNRSLFRAGEELSLKMSCSALCYLAVLNLTANRVIHVLYPNPFEPNTPLQPMETRHVPSPEQSSRYGLRVDTMPGNDQNVEWIKVIATKDPFPLGLFLETPHAEPGKPPMPAVTDFRSVQELILSIPLDRRNEVSLSYIVLSQDHDRSGT